MSHCWDTLSSVFLDKLYIWIPCLKKKKRKRPTTTHLVLILGQFRWGFISLFLEDSRVLETMQTSFIPMKLILFSKTFIISLCLHYITNLTSIKLPSNSYWDLPSPFKIDAYMCLNSWTAWQLARRARRCDYDCTCVMHEWINVCTS